MTVTDLIPRKRNRDVAVTRAPAISADHRDPFIILQREMNRLFDSLWNGFGQHGALADTGPWPDMDLFESDQEYTITAELPGVEEKDIELLLVDGGLTLRGEKKCEHQDWHHRLSERYYGRFERRMPLPEWVDEDRIKASFRNGVLTVSLPKFKAAPRSMRRIALQTT